MDAVKLCAEASLYVLDAGRGCGGGDRIGQSGHETVQIALEP
ncbi:hypothetical protein [Mesorhizobium muleiense]|nr:hypothetical protein [Mesorhizobium muleiense]